MKVFCYKCKYLDTLREYRCINDNNIWEEDTWLQTVNHDKDEPSTINKANDCKWFEGK